MKNNITLSCFVVSVFILLFYSCKEESNIYYLDSDADVPAQVTNIQVSATPGGALITYEIPVDKNLSYVKAVYEIQPGVYREAKSSFYADSLSLEGFGDTLTHLVRIFSVGRNEKLSDPITIDVVPLTPPVKSVFKTLAVKPTFGGLNVSFTNDLQADLAAVIIVDTIGDKSIWAEASTFYTDALRANYSSRGFESIEQNFGVYLRDRWSNKSDTMYVTLTPLYEELLDFNNMKALALPTDAPVLSPYVLSNIIDGTTGNANNIYASMHDTPLPEWFTLDLGSRDGNKSILSRLKMFHRPAQYAYNQAVPLKFEIWGSNIPDPQGSWEGWFFLGSFESYKPSGLPLGQNNADDIAYAVTQGEDFEFEITPAPYRYFRFKTIDTYGGGGQVVLAELKFWGQVVNE